MSITLTGNGSMFGTLGKIFGAQRAINGFRAATDPTNSSLWGSGGAAVKCVGTAFSDIFTQLAASATIKPRSNGLFSTQDGYRSQHTGVLAELQTLGSQVVYDLANGSFTLPDTLLSTAIQRLIAEMTASSDSVKKNAVSATVTEGTNTGTPKVIASIVNGVGANREYVFAENLTLTVATDAQSGTGTLGQESINYVGKPAADNFDYAWPAGSGATGSITIVDPTSSANLLTNSGFDTFTTAGQPDYWVICNGTANSSINSNSSILLNVNSTYSLTMVGDGSAQRGVQQTFNDSTNGTRSALKPSTVYGICTWGRVSAATNGTLALQLIDGNGTVTTDVAGTGNNITQNLTGVSNSSFTAISGFFRTPAVLPTTLKLRLITLSAIDNGKTLYLDGMAMVELAESSALYTRGPFVAAFRGATDCIIGDSWTITIANDYGGKLQTEFERNFAMREKNLQLPSASSPTVADTVIS